jgi:hypothetical protein
MSTFSSPVPQPGSSMHYRKRHGLIPLLLFLAAAGSGGLGGQTPAGLSLSGPSQVRLGGTAQYSALLNGVASPVVWSVNGFAGGTGSTGPIPHRSR